MGRSVFETLTVLVADDSAQMRTLLDRLLQALGVGRIVTAADGEEAWAKFIEHRPDVVITDAAMTPMDGFVFAGKLRAADDARLGPVPIIMISAHTELSAIEKARDIGVSEFLCKPVSARSLYERLLKVVSCPMHMPWMPAGAPARPSEGGFHAHR